MTKDEFEAGYAERSGIMLERLHELGQRGVPCQCDYADCKGWQMTTVRPYEEFRAELGLASDIPYDDRVEYRLTWEPRIR